MGALSTKITRLDLRKWDTKLITINSTVFFIELLTIFVEKECISYVESKNQSNMWLSERNKLFFHLKTVSVVKNRDFYHILNFITFILYTSQFLCLKKYPRHSFTVICAAVSVEILTLLLSLTENIVSFSVKKIQKSHVSLNLEKNYQNNGLAKIASSKICILISTNSKHQDEKLNFMLKKRGLKNNFKCMILGSAAHFNFQTVFLGSNFMTLKNICEGNHLFCQDLKRIHNPLILFSNSVFSKNKSKTHQKVLNVLRFMGIFHSKFFNFHVVSTAVIALNLFNMQQIKAFTKQDLIHFNIIYFLNLPYNNIWFLKNILDSKIISFYFSHFSSAKKTVINYSNRCFKKILSSSQITAFNLTQWNYFYMPQNNYFANHESYFNTDGKISRMSHDSFAQVRTTWITFKKLYRHFIKTSIFCGDKSRRRIFFNSNLLSSTQNLAWFQYFGSSAVSFLSSYLILKNKAFSLNKFGIQFKCRFEWFQNYKMKYESQDFFIAASDPYSCYSKNLILCSKTKKAKSRIIPFNNQNK